MRVFVTLKNRYWIFMLFHLNKSVRLKQIGKEKREKNLLTVQNTEKK